MWNGMGRAFIVGWLIVVSYGGFYMGFSSFVGITKIIGGSFSSVYSDYLASSFSLILLLNSQQGQGGRLSLPTPTAQPINLQVGDKSPQNSTGPT